MKTQNPFPGGDCQMQASLECVIIDWLNRADLPSDALRGRTTDDIALAIAQYGMAILRQTRKQYVVSGPSVHSILRAYPYALREQDSDSVLAEMFVSTAEALQRDHPTLSVEENIGYKPSGQSTSNGQAEQAPNLDAETYSRSGDYYKCPSCKSFLGHRLIVKDIEKTWQEHRRVCKAARPQPTCDGEADELNQEAQP